MYMYTTFVPDDNTLRISDGDLLDKSKGEFNSLGHEAKVGRFARGPFSLKGESRVPCQREINSCAGLIESRAVCELIPRSLTRLPRRGRVRDVIEDIRR